MLRTITFICMMFISTIVQAGSPRIKSDSAIRIVRTSVTGINGTRHFLNYDFEWRNEDPTEFEVWIKWDDGKIEFISDLPPHPGTFDWDTMDVNSQEVSRPTGGVLHIQVKDSFSGNKVEGQRRLPQ